MLSGIDEQRMQFHFIVHLQLCQMWQSTYDLENLMCSNDVPMHNDQGACHQELDLDRPYTHCMEHTSLHEDEPGVVYAQIYFTTIE